METEKRLVWTTDVMSFLCKRCNEMYPDEPCEPCDCLMTEELDKCKTVDAVEVVRCRDCKWWKEYHCTNINGAFGVVENEDWFCCSGERK